MAWPWYWREIGVGVRRCPYRRGAERQRLPTRGDYLRARSHAAAMRRAIEFGELHRAGLSYAAIGARLGVSRERARQRVQAYENWARD